MTALIPRRCHALRCDHGGERFGAPTRRALVWLMVIVATALGLDGGWIHAKAWLAQRLLERAWQTSLTTHAPHRPWPWADTHPVARLVAPAQGVERIVLAGDSGRTLAFGPGWAEASAAPGDSGVVVIGGHRDTHFAFLQSLHAGDELRLESARGTVHYRVASLSVADTRRESVALGADNALVLVTCWPFDAWRAGGPLRYVVRAVPMVEASLAQSRRVTAADSVESRLKA